MNNKLIPVVFFALIALTILLKFLGVPDKNIGFIVIGILGGAIIFLTTSLLYMKISDKLAKRKQKRQEELDDQHALKILEAYIENENFACMEVYMEKHPLTWSYSSQLKVQKDLERLSPQAKEKLLALLKRFSQETPKKNIPVHVEYFLQELA